MTPFKRAFILASAERYVVFTINFLTLPILARLLTPQEFGVSLLGGAIMTLVESTREFGTGNYLLKELNITQENIHTAFSINALMTIFFGTIVFFAAPWLAFYFATPDLCTYLRVTLISFCLGPLCSPTYSLLRRDLRFGHLAIVSISSTTVGAVSVVGLAALGFSYMSFAYSIIASATTGVALLVYFYGDVSIFRPSLANWRQFVSFGRYDTGTDILYRAWDNLPILLFGKILGANVVGIYQRASLLATLPERVFLSALGNIYLPALNEQIRQGRKSEESFLKVLEYVSAVYWPTLAVVSLLAHPIIVLLLSPRWIACVPLVQIIAIAMMFEIPAGLVYSTLTAAGAVRDVFLIALIFVPTASAVFGLAALDGPILACYSLIGLFVFKSVMSLYFVQKRIDLSWSHIGTSLSQSALLTAATATGPLLVIALCGFRTDLSLPLGVIAGVSAVAGYFACLWGIEHPFVDLLRQFASTTRGHADRGWRKLQS